ncbi:hypothetical protein M0R04_14940 [Candidatus Dojkabacteria bacterium]|jgi:hypothetical protein|nr:hypothetical protein [Candidatus Dojkabacteria bacterium]
MKKEIGDQYRVMLMEDGVCVIERNNTVTFARRDDGTLRIFPLGLAMFDLMEHDDKFIKYLTPWLDICD